MVTEFRSAEEVPSIALEIAGEEPTIRPSLVKFEILKALKEAGSLEDRDSIKMRVLAALRAAPRRLEGLPVLPGPRHTSEDESSRDLR